MMKRLHYLLFILLIGSASLIGSALPTRAAAQSANTRVGFPKATLADEKSVLVYPNPSTGIVHLTINGFENRRVELRVLNVIGSVVYRELLTELSDRATKTLDLSKISSGLYYIKLEGDNVSEMRKLVIR
ncbi:T9SS type A sorting domain-containing protein [Hymenobacter sp. NBH84]|nr:T9SS type A sorting domain-containing protein [Hymenobacter sp. NBH84]